MAFFGGGGGGLFGTGASSGPTFQIVGINSALLSASYDAQLFQRSVATLPPSQAIESLNDGPAVIPPWEVPEESRSLVSRINEVRSLTSFIDTSRGFLEDAGNDLDKQASFTIFKALDNLRVLAQYAAEKTTPDSTLDRLNEQFRSGFTELQTYLGETELDKLTLFLGDKVNRTETDVRLGKNETEYVGSVIQTGSLDDPLTGLNGDEIFDITLTKSGESDTITVDLSEMTETLTMNSFIDFVNSKIEAVPLLDEFGDPELDDDNNPIAKYQTRFSFEPDSNYDYALKIEGTITEEIVLTPQNVEPGLVVTGDLTRADGYGETRSFIQDVGDLSGTMTTGDRTDFAGIMLAETTLKTEIDAQESEDEDLDPAIAKLKAEMLADAAGDSEDDTDEVDEDIGSITNLDGKSVVAGETNSNGVVVDSTGNIYVVGQSSGSFGHQINTASDSDVYLTKFDSEGNVIYSRLLGSSGEASGFDITLDSSDNVIIAGQTDNALSDSDVLDSTDAFVAKYTSGGDEVFRYQLDTISTTSGLSVSVDASDNILLAGKTAGAISATSGYSGGGSDGLVLQIDGTAGTLMQSAVIGDTDAESIKGIAVAADGNILVAMEDGGNAVLKKLDATDLTNEMFSVDLGSLGQDGSIQGLEVDGNQVFVLGVSDNAGFGAGTVNGSHAGGLDGYVTALTDNGASASADYTTYVGTTGTDRIVDVTVSGGKLYLAGSTADTLTGETSTGATDGFVARLDASTGTVEDTQQFGTAFHRMDVGGVAFSSTGGSFLSKLGLPSGAINSDETRDITTQTSARVGDHFYIQFEGSIRKTKITIEAGDTFEDIARRIRIAAVGKVKATVSTTSEGEKLKLESINGQGFVELLAGDDGADALTRLGMAPTKLVPSDDLFSIGDSEDENNLGGGDGGVFGLKLDPSLMISDKTSAKYVVGVLDDAISTIQRAFRSTVFDPLKALLAEQARTQGGTPPAYLSARIANYQDGLARMQALSFGGSVGFSI